MARKTHGKSSTRLYKIWQGVKQCCYNKKHSQYKYYGGKGIKLHDDWHNFTDFEVWSYNNGYKDNLTIDRIHSTRGYEPNNCQWISQSENSKKIKRFSKNNNWMDFI